MSDPTRNQLGGSTVSGGSERVKILLAPIVVLLNEKTGGRLEISATVSEAVAEAFENAKALLAEGSSVVTTNIAGTRFVPRCDAWIVESMRLGD